MICDAGARRVRGRAARSAPPRRARDRSARAAPSCLRGVRSTASRRAVIQPHGSVRFSHSEQVPLRRPVGSDIVCFGRSRAFMAAWKLAGGAKRRSTPSRRSPSMRSSCYMHGGFYTAPLAAFLRQRRRVSAGAKEGTASSSALAASPLARAPRAPSARPSGDNRPWGAERLPRPPHTTPHASRLEGPLTQVILFRARTADDEQPRCP